MELRSGRKTMTLDEITNLRARASTSDSGQRHSQAHRMNGENFPPEEGMMEVSRPSLDLQDEAMGNALAPASLGILEVSQPSLLDSQSEEMVDVLVPASPEMLTEPDNDEDEEVDVIPSSDPADPTMRTGSFIQLQPVGLQGEQPTSTIVDNDANSNDHDQMEWAESDSTSTTPDDTSETNNAQDESPCVAATVPANQGEERGDPSTSSSSSEQYDTASSTVSENTQQRMARMIKEQLERDRFELALIEVACRRYNEHNNFGLFVKLEIGREGTSMITPEHWLKFRNYILTTDRLILGSETVLIKRREKLCKDSNRKPICIVPSCFSTDGTFTQLLRNPQSSSDANPRCFRHYGDMLVYAVVELVFREQLHGVDIAVGIEHVQLVFCHHHSDTPFQIRKRLLDEYKNCGLLQQSLARLKKHKLRMSERNLSRTGKVSIQREWIFYDNPYEGRRGARQASRKYFVVGGAAALVYKLLNFGVKLVPFGPFKNKHLVVLTEGFNLEPYTPGTTDVKRLKDDIIREQVEMYGVYDLQGPVLTLSSALITL